jgi:large-conductance mechanosensitive channel
VDEDTAADMVADTTLGAAVDVDTDVAVDVVMGAAPTMVINNSNNHSMPPRIKIKVEDSTKT